MPQSAVLADSSPPAPSFRDTLTRLSSRTQSRWWRTSTSQPNLGPKISYWRKRRNERALDRFEERFEKKLGRPSGKPGSLHLRDPGLRELLGLVGDEVLPFPEAERRIIFSDAYFEATAQFVEDARDFDPELPIHDLSQALRNVWIMHLAQLLLERPLVATPPIFAYSLLYPYTDNALDDPDLDAAAKRRFCQRLGRRLEGARLLPLDPRERSVFRLVGMIEEHWSRCDFPEVFDSLLAIHDAQAQSLSQQKLSRCDAETLRVSVEKGGASVLADGYLVAGDLSPSEVDFFFAYGVLLQLADDLQDVEQDLEAGHVTLFTSQARRRPLDDLTNRLVNFLDDVLAAERFSAPRFAVLRSLIRNSCVQLVVQSVGQHPRFFSRPYRRWVERHGLTRGSYLRKKRLGRPAVSDRPVTVGDLIKA